MHDEDPSFYENGEFFFSTVDRKIFSVIVSLPGHIPFVDLKNSSHIKKSVNSMNKIKEYAYLHISILLCLHLSSFN